MALKLGVIGCGGIANSHMHGYLELGDAVEIVACCDINFKKANEFADRYGIPNRYDNCYDMLKNHQLDIVSVCTWNSAHAECTIAALQAGCNVLCEKPMAMNAKEAEAMQAAAEKAGKLLMLGFVRRHGRDAAKARRLVTDGALGEVYYAKASYLRRSGYPGGWFGDKSRSGGGPLIDLGVHIIDLSRYIMGSPKPVTVFGATFDKIGARAHITEGGEWQSQTEVDQPIFDVEDLAVAMIRFDNGAVLSVETSFNLNMKAPSNTIEFFGSKAGLTLDPFELHTEYDNAIADIVIHGDNGFHFQPDFDKEVKNFVESVQGDAECKAKAEDGVLLMKILDAVYESAKTGKSVDVV
ncbi:MAG: Gfo/Idh/MocA family oxidoreductase [Clostridia bacterium]|nr:Gfo/Idh/MocA family oxidoreductase [Clostridia bacterium]MBR0537310.1 Gfo/Idh/MocA family oxidoreductase [Clostridia bacterium]